MTAPRLTLITPVRKESWSRDRTVECQKILLETLKMSAGKKLSSERITYIGSQSCVLCNKPIFSGDTSVWCHVVVVGIDGILSPTFSGRRGILTWRLKLAVA